MTLKINNLTFIKNKLLNDLIRINELDIHADIHTINNKIHSLKNNELSDKLIPIINELRQCSSSGELQAFINNYELDVA